MQTFELSIDDISHTPTPLAKIIVRDGTRVSQLLVHIGLSGFDHPQVQVTTRKATTGERKHVSIQSTPIERKRLRKLRRQEKAAVGEN